MTRTPARLALCLGVALGVAAGSIGVASASAPDTSACKNGGYVNYVDPATGQPFANQGRCVSTVARGGALVPVTPPLIHHDDWQVQPVADQPTCNVSTSFAGGAGTAYPVTWTDSSGVVLAAYSQTAGPDGLLPINLVTPPSSSATFAPVTLTVGDQMYTSPPVSCYTVQVDFGPAPAFPGNCTVTFTLTHLPLGDATSVRQFLDGAAYGGFNNMFPGGTDGRAAGAGPLPAGHDYALEVGDPFNTVVSPYLTRYEFGTITCS